MQIRRSDWPRDEWPLELVVCRFADYHVLCVDNLTVPSHYRFPLLNVPDTFTTQLARGTTKGRYAFVSLGCPKNLVDSERMLGMLRLDGDELGNDPQGGGFAVGNTCG